MLTLSRSRRMPSCMRLSGRFTVHRLGMAAVSSVRETFGQHDGPSIARITSSAGDQLGSRASRYPPLVPYSETRNPVFPSFCKQFREQRKGMPQTIRDLFCADSSAAFRAGERQNA